MGKMFILRIVWILILVRDASGVYSAAKETEIRSETVLATSYDPISRPVAQTNVKAGISILAIDQLDLKNQMFTAAGWMTFEWEDARLTWNKALKDDIEYIYSQPSKIWKPELVIDNSMDEVGVINDANLLLRIKDDGTVDWEPPMQFSTHCEVDVRWYPYDNQRCGIELASWGYTINEVTLTHLRTVINLEDFETHGEWTISKSTLTLQNLTETKSDGSIEVYPKLEFWVHMSRRSSFYNLNVVMPIFLTSMLIVLVFIVPVDSGEKISYVLTVLLSLAVLLTLVADAMPPTSITVSVLGLYLGIVLVLSAVAVLLTVLVIILYHTEGQPHPRSCLVSLARCLDRVTFQRKMRPSRRTAKVHSVVSMKSAEISDMDEDYLTWKLLSEVIDKFLFYAFTIVTVLMNMICIIVLTVGADSEE